MPYPVAAARGHSVTGSGVVPIDPLTLFSTYSAIGVWYPNFTDLTSMFQVSTGSTNVTATTQPIGLALERSQWGGATVADTYIAGQPELVTNGSFATDTDWTKGTGWTIGGGKASQAGGNSAAISQSISLTVGYAMNVLFTTLDVTGAQVAPHVGGNFGAAVTGNSANRSVIIVPSGATSVAFFCNASFVGSIDDVSVKSFPGNHGIQATSSARPTVQLPASRYVLRGDGSDDNLLSTLLAVAGGGTIIARFKCAAASKAIAGTQGAADGRFYLGLNASGFVGAGIGADSYSTIHGADDRRNTEIVACVVYDGSNVTLLEQLIGGAAETVYQAAQNGAVNTTIPFRILANNVNGTGGQFASADLDSLFIIQAALTPADRLGAMQFMAEAA